jgi:hypothetical protein
MHYAYLPLLVMPFPLEMSLGVGAIGRDFEELYSRDN